MIQNPLRTPLKLHAPALLGLCCFLPPASAAFPGVRSFRVCWSPLAFLPPRPRSVWSCLPALLPAVLVGVCCSSSFVDLGCFVGVAWFLFCWVCLVFLCGGCLCWFLSFASCFCWLRLTSVWTGTFVYSAFTCATCY